MKPNKGIKTLPLSHRGVNFVIVTGEHAPTPAPNQAKVHAHREVEKRAI